MEIWDGVKKLGCIKITQNRLEVAECFSCRPDNMCIFTLVERTIKNGRVGLCFPIFPENNAAVEITDRYGKNPFLTAKFPYSFSRTSILQAVHIMDKQYTA